MRIAQIAPPWFPVPPLGYGGTELVVSLVTDGLVDRGHDVTLFASGGSRTKARLVSPLADPPDPSVLGDPWYDTFHALTAYLAIDDSYDVVHDHSGIIGPAIGTQQRGRPAVVHTLHGPWTEKGKAYYDLIQDRVHLVAISESQRDHHPEARYAGVVYNGIDLDAYPFVEKKDDYLVYIGRSNPDKGPTLAIEVARRAGRRLAMVLKRNEPAERSYFDDVIAPQLGDDIDLYEAIPHEQKAELLGKAAAMVFPIQWPEPFGLVMVEAMACGTPVVTCPFGAAVELIDDGVTGFVRRTVDELVDAVNAAGTCSPYQCRERVARQFSSDAMVATYEEIYRQIVQSTGSTAAGTTAGGPPAAARRTWRLPTRFARR